MRSAPNPVWSAGFLDVRLRAQIVNFSGLNFSQIHGKASGVSQIAENKVYMVTQMGYITVTGVGIAAQEAVDTVIFFQKKFGQIGAILTGNAGNKGGFRFGGHDKDKLYMSTVISVRMEECITRADFFLSNMGLHI